jgi:hypothetical protein
VVAFVRRHQDPSLATILRWFQATPADAVRRQVNEALDVGEMTIRRNGLSRKAGYVYCVQPDGRNVYAERTA